VSGGERPDAAAILVAAGRGERAGAGPPKQFRELGGVPVLERAWRPFAGSDEIAELVLVLPADAVEDPPAWLRDAPARRVPGGETRTESVARGLEAVSSGAGRILVHDGVRPFCSPALVRSVLAAAADGPVVPLLQMRDTVKEVDRSGRVVRTPERASLRRAQTPQGFTAEVLREAHRRAARSGEGATDDAALCEAMGEVVRGVEGEETNLKLTTPADFEYAAWLLETGRVR